MKHTLHTIVLLLVFHLTTTLSYAQTYVSTKENRGIYFQPTKTYTTARNNDKKIAFILGNEHYTYESVLKNAANDAIQLEEKLSKLGFETVLKTDLNFLEMQQFVNDFAKEISNYQVCLFYYAGHGFGINGEDYLLPTDYQSESKVVLDQKALSLRQVSDILTVNSQHTNIIMLDACRNFIPVQNNTNTRERTPQTIGYTGLVNPPKGTIICYSSSPGEVSFDRHPSKPNNGLYTGTLLKYIEEPISFFDLLGKVRLEVDSLSKGRQIPMERNKLSAESLYLNPTLSSTDHYRLYANNKMVYWLQDSINRLNDQVQQLSDSIKIISGISIKTNTPKDNLYVNETGMTFTLIKGSTFELGCDKEECKLNEYPVHLVTVNDYWVSQYEVTLQQFELFIEETSYLTDAEKKGYVWFWENGQWVKKDGLNWRFNAKGSIAKDKSLPVIFVSWNDALAFTKWLSSKSNDLYTLPTEAEWEFAARSREFNSINYEKSPDSIINYAYVWNNSYGQPHPVGEKNANQIGLFDMTGNVWEWCYDLYGAYPNQHLYNPKGASNGSLRVLKGGSWLSHKKHVRIAIRNFDDADNCSNTIGFRVVKR